MLGIFLDTETNGLDPKKHKIFEIAYRIIDVSSGEEKHSLNCIISHPQEVWNSSEPTSLNVNGLTWDDICRGEKEDLVSEKIKKAFQEIGLTRKNSVFICQNPSFDRAFFSQLISVDLQEKLNLPYHWLDLASMFWALSLHTRKALPWEIGLSKDNIAKTFNINPESKPHRAINGVDHLVMCYQAIIGFPNNIKGSIIPE